MGKLDPFWKVRIRVLEILQENKSKFSGQDLLIREKIVDRMKNETVSAVADYLENFNNVLDDQLKKDAVIHVHEQNKVQKENKSKKEEEAKKILGTGRVLESNVKDENPPLMVEQQLVLLDLALLAEIVETDARKINMITKPQKS